MGKLREWAKLRLKWLTVRTKAGPLKGMKWIAVAGTNFFMGRYEESKTEGLLKCVQPSDIVYDIGGQFHLVKKNRHRILSGTRWEPAARK